MDARTAPCHNTSVFFFFFFFFSNRSYKKINDQELIKSNPTCHLENRNRRRGKKDTHTGTGIPLAHAGCSPTTATKDYIVTNSICRLFNNTIASQTNDPQHLPSFVDINTGTARQCWPILVSALSNFYRF